MSTSSNPVVSVTFVYPADSSIFDPSSGTQEPEYVNYQQLETDVNSALQSRFQASLDSLKWDALSADIGNLVAEANANGISAEAKSLIYGQIMIIITAEYLPVVSDFLGDQIAEQAATENIASDVSAFIISAQNGFNAVSESSTSSTDQEDSFFNGVMALIGNEGGTTGEDSSSTINPDYNFTFFLNYTYFDTETQSFVIVSADSGAVGTEQDNVLDLLTDTTIWGSSSTTPLSSSEASQIDTALINIASTYNAGIIPGSNFDPDNPNSSSSITPAAPEDVNCWLNGDLSSVAFISQTWQFPYGVSSYDETFGTQNAPVVYTEPNTIQSDLNQASQAVETVANATQTVENFQIQEIDQYYGIINSIQQSQQSQCAAIVRKQSGG